MRILVVGGGGREHALAWKLASSESVQAVYVAPGNAGTANDDKLKNIPISDSDINALVSFAKDFNIDLTVVGPETPLVNGIADQFALNNRRCLGPTKNAAKLEGSKAFAKKFMERHQIPTARYGIFDNSTEANRYANKIGPPLVVKADGLAAGKGVIIAQSLVQAELAIRQILDEHKFGSAGNVVVVEEFIVGEEVSFICMVSNDQFLPLATSQDHKARDNGDKGPNTGGMGAYSPAPVITKQLHERVVKQVVEPTLRGLNKDGISYTGFLYAGLIIDQDGQPKVLEYNCRAGDPETQPILFRLRSDFAALCDATLAGELHRTSVIWDPKVALSVVMASKGYPGKYSTGDIVSGLTGANTSEVKVFHSGTTTKNGNIVTDGGRVLCVTALGDTVTLAQSRAYQAVETIAWNQSYYRKDIGHRAIIREKSDITNSSIWKN